MLLHLITALVLKGAPETAVAARAKSPAISPVVRKPPEPVLVYQSGRQLRQMPFGQAHHGSSLILTLAADEAVESVAQAGPGGLVLLSRRGEHARLKMVKKSKGRWVVQARPVSPLSRTLIYSAKDHSLAVVFSDLQANLYSITPKGLLQWSHRSRKPVPARISWVTATPPDRNGVAYLLGGSASMPDGDPPRLGSVNLRTGKSQRPAIELNANSSPAGIFVSQASHMLGLLDTFGILTTVPLNSNGGFDKTKEVGKLALYLRAGDQFGTTWTSDGSALWGVTKQDRVVQVRFGQDNRPAISTANFGAKLQGLFWLAKAPGNSRLFVGLASAPGAHRRLVVFNAFDLNFPAVRSSFLVDSHLRPLEIVNLGGVD